MALRMSGEASISREVTRESEALRRFARGVLLERAEAEDAVQEAWLAALRQPGPLPSSSWLREAVRRIARGLRRREQRVAAHERTAARAEATPSSLETVARLEVLRELVAALEQLPEPYRTAVRLRYLDDLPPRAIAKRLGLPVETVRTHVKRGIERLRARLDVEHRGGRGSLLAALVPLAGFESAGAMVSAAVGTKPILGALMGVKLKVAVALTLLIATGWWWTVRESAQATTPGAAELSEAVARPTAAGANAESNEAVGVLLEATRPELGVATRTAASPQRDWQIRGRATRGATGDAYPAARLRIHVLSGYDGPGESLCDELVQADEQGRFAIALARPEGGVRISAGSALESVLFALRSLRTVRGGAPAPEDLDVQLYPLDLTLRGRVVDREGAPIEAAMLTGIGTWTRSAADGGFELMHSTLFEQIVVEAQAAGFVAKRLVLDTHTPGTLENLSVRLETGAPLRGRIVDEQGQPVPRAKILAQAELSLRTQSDDAGRFEIHSLPQESNWISIHVRAEGFAHLRRDIKDFRLPAQELEIVLARGIDVPGVLLDDHGVPRPGELVFEGATRWELDGAEAISDEAGRFVLRDLPRGSCDIGVAASGFEAYSRKLDLPSSGAFAGELRIELGRGRELHGLVQDPMGKPIPRAIAHVRRDRTQLGTEHAIAGEDGRFTLHGVPTAGALEVMIVAAGFVTLRQPIEPGVLAEQQYVLQPAAGLAGRVVDARSGNPVTSFRVRFLSAKLEPDEIPLTGYEASWIVEGREFREASGEWDTQGESLVAGQITALEISAPGFGPSIVERAVARLDPRAEPIVVALGPAARVSGRVVDARDGSPVPNARVRRCVARDALGPWFQHAESHRAQATTDARGDFSLDGLPLEAMSLYVERDGFAVAFDGPFEAVGDMPPRVIALAQGARVRGVVRDHTGRALPDVQVQLSATAVERQEYRSFDTSSDGEGRFEFSDLSLGEYQLSRGVAFADEYRSGVLFELSERVVLDEARVFEVELRPRGDCAILGRLTSARELPHEVRVFATRMSSPGTPEAPMRAAIALDGRFELRGLEAGRWELRFGADPWSSKSPTVVELAGRREENVVVELP